jgi:thiol-disulfide isomerase/thioredoxin
MKIKNILLLTGTLVSCFAFNVPAQTAPPAVAPAPAADADSSTKTALRTLIGQVQAKIKAGKKTEADLAEELKTFDQLIASENGAKTDEAAQIVFMKAMLYIQILNEPDKGKALIGKIKTDYPETKYGQDADKILAQLDEQADADKKQEALFGTGKTFSDFSEKDLSGNPISVANYKGKVVLVDFWATWCGPCRGELPNVIATYKKYHDQGFEIIGVSLDSDRDKLDAFLKQQDGMTWPEFFDGQGWKNKLAVKYGVESIPFSVLVGPDGKILGRELRGEALGEAVGAALAK